MGVNAVSTREKRSRGALISLSGNQHPCSFVQTFSFFLLPAVGRGRR